MTTQANITTQILFFASIRELVGQSRVTIGLNTTCTVAELLQQLYQEHPALTPLLQDQELLYAVNQQLATLQTQVQPGDEVALFPFVTGG